MFGIKTIEELSKQRWLDRTGKAVQEAISAAYEAGGKPGRQLKDVLHGTWLGHSLHPVLTDLPIGAWTTTTLLDAIDLITGEERMAPAAEAIVSFGLVTSLATALSGLTDWQHAEGEARGVGLAHGLLNVSATLLYGGSLLARRGGEPDLGRALAGVGFAVSSAAAYLGGDLVFRLRMGVNQAPVDPETEGFVEVLADAELAEGALRRVEVGDTAVVLARQGRQVYALAETCAHMCGPLSEGKLEGTSVRCPWHGSRFDLRDGSVREGPSAYPQPCFETRVRNGKIELRAAPPQQEREVEG